jgi:diguanylate cyclase (GGDEF)-like protein
MAEPIQESAPAKAAVSSVDMRPYSKRQQLFQELIKDGELLLKNRLEVRHLMTADPIVIPPTMPIGEIEFLMKERRLHHLLVCGRGGDLLGIVSDRDLHPQRGATAQQLMTYPVLTATPETPLNPAITFLINENISCLPVVENGRLCGILTTTDLVLSLQCMLQLWLRMAQVLQQDSGWNRELDKIAASLDGNLSQSDYAAQMQKVRAAIHHQLEDILNCVDLHADVLTGIDNRRGLEEMLDMLLAVQNRYGHAFSLVMVVIDHYQQISKSCGDAAVKALLKAVAKMIQRSVRSSDFVARCHDAAFAVVLTHTGLERAAALCRRLHQIAKQNTDLDMPLRISTGAVAPEPGEDTAHLLARAQAAAASHSG